MNITVISAKDLTPEDTTIWSGIVRANSELASPFFYPEFTTAVSSVRSDVYVAIMEKDNKVVGFFPFQKHLGRIGRPVGWPLSDCHGAVVLRELQFNAYELIKACGLRVWYFDHLLSKQGPFKKFHEVNTETAIIDLTDGYISYREEMLQTKSKQIRKAEKLEKKIEHDIGPIKYLADVKDKETLSTLFAWKSEQWKRSKGFDLFSFIWITKLMEKILEFDKPGFQGMLSVLLYGEKIAAVHMGMRSERVWHYWFPAYNRRFSKYSPGILLLLRMAESAQSLGIKYIDLGKGDEFYKKRLANNTISLAEGSIFTSQLYKRLLPGIVPFLVRQEDNASGRRVDRC